MTDNDQRTLAQIMWADRGLIERDLRYREELQQELKIAERRSEELRRRLRVIENVWCIRHDCALERRESDRLPNFGPGIAIFQVWCFKGAGSWNHWFAYVGQRDDRWVVLGHVGRGGACFTTPLTPFATEGEAIDAAAYFAAHGKYVADDGEVVLATNL